MARFTNGALLVRSDVALEGITAESVQRGAANVDRLRIRDCWIDSLLLSVSCPGSISDVDIADSDISEMVLTSSDQGISGRVDNVKVGTLHIQNGERLEVNVTASGRFDSHSVDLDNVRRSRITAQVHNARQHGIYMQGCSDVDVDGLVSGSGQDEDDTWDNIHISGGQRVRVLARSLGQEFNPPTRYGVNIASGTSHIVQSLIDPDDNFATAAITDSGTGTVDQSTVLT